MSSWPPLSAEQEGEAQRIFAILKQPLSKICSL
jgi:hypothetical protein